MTSISLSTLQIGQSIGTFALFGSTAAGKTSTVERFTGKTTKRHSSELESGKSIYMGFTNLKIYRDHKTKHILLNPKPEDISPDYKLIRHFSIADNPGHNEFMAAMTSLITEESNIDFAVFIVSGTAGIEQQTKQHFRCYRSTNNKNITFVISKIDLVPTHESLTKIRNSIDDLMDTEKIDAISSDIDPTIIPTSSVKGTNFDLLVNQLIAFPYPRNIQASVDNEFNMTIVRSFDINKKGVNVNDMVGGVIGGTISGGFLTIGDIICLYPGNIVVNKDGSTVYVPLVTQVVELHCDNNPLEFAVSGGFISVRTTLDPCYMKNNGMVGQVVKKIDNINDIQKKCSVANYVEIDNIEELDSEYKYVQDTILLVVAHACCQDATIITVKPSSSKKGISLVLLLHRPIQIGKHDKIALLSKTGIGTTFVMKMLGFGDVVANSPVKCTMELQNNCEEFINMPPNPKSSVKTLKIVDDLENIDVNVDDLYDWDAIVQKLKFQQSSFSINLPSVNIEKTTTSICITNAYELFNEFVDNEPDMLLLMWRYIEIVKQNMSSNGTANMHTCATPTKISFDKLRSTNRFMVKDFNKAFEEFVISNFTCNSCKQPASIHIVKKTHVCRACGASY